ncbi:MAG: hypothetical protein AAGA87_16975 [Pseudomonadota bacterium]
MAEENINNKQLWMKYEKLMKKEGNKADGDPSKGLPFAFNYDSSPAGEHVFYTHKTKKNQDKLGKEARGAGKGTKAAFGRVYMEGNMVVFKCDRSIPNMPKSVKNFFKTMKVKKKLQIIDEEGVSTDVAEEDEENQALDTAQATEAPAEEATEPTARGGAEPGAEETDGGNQAAAHEGRMGDLEKMVDKWFAKDSTAKGAMAEAKQMIGANDADGADRKITEVEALLDKIGDPAKIVDKAKELKDKIGDPEDDRGRKLTDAVRMAAKLMSNKTVSDFERASGMLDKIEEAVKKMGGAAGGGDDSADREKKREEIMSKVKDIGKQVEEMMAKYGIT